MQTPGLGIAVAALLAVLGLRVFVQARRDGASPDDLVGVFFLCLGIGGVPALLSHDPGVIPPAIARTSTAFGHAMLSAGFIALLVFAWRCFGPSSTWRRNLALGASAVLVLAWILQGLIEGFAPSPGPVVRAASLVRGAALVWALCETLSYRAAMGRRVKLGLADRLVVNRFTLWCIWMGGVLANVGIAVTVRFLRLFGHLAAEGSAVPWIAFPFMGLCLVSGAALYLAFFPPAWYASWVRGGASPTAA